jgi:NTP pyrophosphatase (non-canonical NTP hydrolase)
MGIELTIRDDYNGQFGWPVGDRQNKVIGDCVRERARQDSKWGEQNHHPMEWLSILMEEVGEAAKAANEGHWSHQTYADYRKELIEVMAVACAAVEDLDRHQGQVTRERP